jgi:hypothetical protein
MPQPDIICPYVDMQKRADWLEAILDGHPVLYMGWANFLFGALRSTAQEIAERDIGRFQR